MIKKLTAFVIFSIIWFVVVAALGVHFQPYLVQPERDLPLFYAEGLAAFGAGLFVKWRTR